MYRCELKTEKGVTLILRTNSTETVVSIITSSSFPKGRWSVTEEL